MFSVLAELVMYLAVDVLFEGVFRATGLGILRVGTGGRIVPGAKVSEVPSGAKARTDGFTYDLGGATFLFADYVPLVGIAVWVAAVLLVLVVAIVYHIVGFGT